MPRLVHDRYLEINAAQACDLATGDVVSIDDALERGGERPMSCPALVEVLDHGRDGEPRAVVMDARSGTRWRVAVDRIAVDAVEHGYVPIGVDVYSRLSTLLANDLRDRTLLLVAGDRDRGGAARALTDAAARTPRPHVLVTLRTRAGTGAPIVREARATYAATARLRVAAPLPADVAQHVQRAVRAADFVAAGRHAAAERLLRDVAGALLRRSAWTPAADAYIALGRLLLERGRAAPAVLAFDEAAAAAVRAEDAGLEVSARIWQATARTDAAQLTAAESICRALLLVGALTGGQRAWAQAALARVLLWQGRHEEIAALAPVAPAEHLGELDVDTRAFVLATGVRALLRRGCLFEAGLHAATLLDMAADAPPLARAIALTSHLAVLAASGDLAAAAGRLRDVRDATTAARSPLRLVRARIVWLDALIRAGRDREAERERRAIVRVVRVAPPLLRVAIEQRTGKCPPSALESPHARRAAVVTAATLVRCAQEGDDDREAVRRVMTAAASRLDATRVDAWSADAGPATVIETVGSGLRSSIGSRVIDAGIAIGPEATDPPWQLGVPVRVGSRLIAALVARWPADRAPAADARTVLELVAAAAAGRIDALLHRARTTAQAALVIPELVGTSGAIAQVRQAVARAAGAPFAVLVEGESGVGKELIARAVHHLSPRRERRFCDVNCAALPDDLLESELFGHARGSFTGAVADRAGLFEEAHGGTLFLDEVADLSPRAQAKLLRVLQQQEIRRVGEAFARPVDVRLVTAANRDMRMEVERGRFRQDLLYRIDVIRITVPALRERPEDIPALAQHFWESAARRVGTAASLSSAVVAALAAYHWPGNVRELQNVIAALAVAAPPRGRVSADLLPGAVTGAAAIKTSRLADAREQFERRFIEVALARTGGNRARAAQMLGLSRQGLIKLMRRLDVAG